MALSYSTEKDEPMDEGTVIPVLRTDVSRLNTQTVWVEQRKVEAVVDTGAVISIMNTKFAEELGAGKSLPLPESA